MIVTPLAILIFILAFGGMVLVHEFGHFIVARAFKIEVEEFGIGLPPSALTLFTWKGTRFTLNWLPLGGFVRPKGENDPNVPGGLAAASPWARLAVLFAGPLMNLLTALVIYSLMVTSAGIPVPERILIRSVIKETPAEAAGIQAGDILIAGQGQKIRSYEDLRNIIDLNENQPIVFLIDRAGEQLELQVTPRRSGEDQRVIIGVYYDEQYTSRPINSWLEAVQFGMRATYNSARNLISLPAQLIRGALPAEQSRLIGFKGIYDIMKYSVASDLEASQSPSTAPTSSPFDQMRTLLIVAALSISLGIINLFPFPALDGGRILFVLPELIFRRRVPHQFETLVHGLGMALLLLLMIYVNVMDFVNPINIPSP
ncbi:MAG TPA: M50 family metallopeptidase [Anaerolineales bacterium]|nr:M50 family metallopeptidase [Anaerolineales bacterium]